MRSIAYSRAFFGVSALLFAVSAAVTIVWSTSMSTMGGMPMPGGWTMSMTWMRMPGQTWAVTAASFLGMWVVMMVAMMLPSVIPMLWRYRRAVATVVLVAVGIFGTLLASGRIELFPEPTPTVQPEPEVTPVVDVSYQVQILNATPEQGLATQMKDIIVTAGWADGSVLASGAGSEDFPETTVFYVNPEDEAAAAGLAEVIGGANIEQSDAYPPADPAVKQLTVVIGLDRTAAGAPTPTP